MEAFGRSYSMQKLSSLLFSEDGDAEKKREDVVSTDAHSERSEAEESSLITLPGDLKAGDFTRCVSSESTVEPFSRMTSISSSVGAPYLQCEPEPYNCIAVSREGVARMVWQPDGEDFDDDGDALPQVQSVILVSPGGKAFYMPDNSAVDWEFIEGATGTSKDTTLA